jgi:hypothetical protein
MRIIFLAAFLTALGPAARAAQAAAPAPAAAPAKPSISPKASSGAVAELDPSQIYTTEKMRDPFRVLSSGSGSKSDKPFTFEDFNIHSLTLRGIMKDGKTDFALFGDASFGVTFTLRGGKLYDGRGKAVPGVTGAVNLRRKTAHLMTPDKDVQTFRLGESVAE